MSQVNADTLRHSGGTLGTDVRIKNTSVYESDGGTSVTQNTVQSLVKAWINLNGTGTIATRDSFNSASITDNGTGEYIDTFTNPMANTTYSASGESGTLGANNENMFVCNFGRSTTGSRGSNMSDGGAAADRDLYCIMVAGDLA
tara:strand:+ start:1853 stop:2284 length:432 start_codon:yes stop_codon:yes gene_type:complete